VQLTFIAYLIVRKYGGPGSEKLAAAMAIFGMFNIPFLYMSVNIWRTIHPNTSVVPTLPSGMPGPFWFSAAAFLILCALLITLRAQLEHRRAALDELYLEYE
jgi:heme exporter protein C